MSDRQRRRSIGIFRPSISPLTRISDTQKLEPSSSVLKKLNPLLHTNESPSTPTSGPTSVSGSPDLQRTDSINSSSERVLSKPRPRSLQKSRPLSIFGSLRSLHSLQDEDANLTRTSSLNSGSQQGSGSGLAILDVAGSAVLHHGEIQSVGGIFRKRSQYLVLTETHLVRFKNHARASDLFPIISASPGKSHSTRHARISSSGSLHDLHSLPETSLVRLNHIVATHKLDDGRPYFSIEIAHMDDEANLASAMTIQLNDPRDSDLWLSRIRAAAEKARLADPLPFTQNMIEYTRRVLEQERDYDPSQFHMFKVVQKATRSGRRASADELGKLASNICVLAIGVYKIHLIPFPKLTRADSATSLSDTVAVSHGIMNLVSLNMQSADDAFQLKFRVPQRPSTALCLASSSITDIALWTRQATDYLRPEWLEQPFTWNVPPSLDDELLPVPCKDEENSCFARTLTAYCAAYGIDCSKIRYSIDHQCDDGPAFQLLDRRRSKYTVLELLAVMRALRYNETFTTISFANIDLTVLHEIYDEHGWDHVPFTTRSGEPVLITNQENSWLLVQEVQALALKSRKLRRLDFSHCLVRKPRDEDDPVQEVGSGICEALFPLCARQLTNVDWIILNGIALADVDIEFFYAAAIQKSCHFRGLDLGTCGLGARNMGSVLQAVSRQGPTMESLNLSGNPARLDILALQKQLRGFCYMRKINLSNICRTSGPYPLIAAEVFLTWKLEYINFSENSLNEESIGALSIYLRSPQSDTVRWLHLNQCQLTGSDLASLLTAMDRGLSKVRDLHLFVADNRLEQQHDKFADAVSRSLTPRKITLQTLEYSSEQYFGDLIRALSKNKSLKYLDISKVTLPKDASDETCDALRKMFMKNRTLEFLDLSGEEAHLEVANLGIGLNHALTGLKNNETLRILRLEHQRLGLQGASTLASIIQVNKGLREIYCENNEINLQAFTVLVNSLKHNTSILYLPHMDNDRAMSLKRIDREFDNLRENTSSPSTMKKTLGVALSSQRSLSSRFQDRSRGAPDAYSNNKEVMAVVRGLSQQWESETTRLKSYLKRNNDLAHSIPRENQVPEATDALTVAFGDTSLDLRPQAETKASLGKGKEVEAGPSSAANGQGEDSSSEVEDLVNVEEGDDIEGALMMSRGLLKDPDDEPKPAGPTMITG